MKKQILAACIIAFTSPVAFSFGPGDHTYCIAAGKMAVNIVEARYNGRTEESVQNTNRENIPINHPERQRVQIFTKYVWESVDPLDGEDILNKDYIVQAWAENYYYNCMGKRRLQKSIN